MSSPFDTSTGAAATLEALAVGGEQSGWRVLDTARALKFTGEIVFETEPAISVYFDAGTAYYAVRAGDPSLCDRLVEVGVVEPAQVERGVIRVGNVENLGRLFDRDPSIDRDAVMVVLEIATDDVVSSVANTVTSSFTSTAYRHHVSGVHRWFVAPSDREGHGPAQLAPVGEVAQIDASVTSDLPGLAGFPDGVDDGVHIEWDQPLGDDHFDAPTTLHAIDESMLQSMFDDASPPAPLVAAAPLATSEIETDVPAADEVGDTVDTVDIVPVAPLAPPSPDGAMSVSVPAPPDIVDDATVPSEADPTENAAAADTDDADLDQRVRPDDNFQIVWPDGSEQALLGPDSSTPTAAPAFDAPPQPASPVQSSSPEVSGSIPEAKLAEPPVVDDSPTMPFIVPADEVVAPAADPVPLSFELPELAVSADNVPDDHQPEEVVDAVRRALEAIESASAVPTRFASVAIADLPSFEPTTPVPLDVVDPVVVDARTEDRDDVAVVADAGAVGDEAISAPEVFESPPEVSEPAAATVEPTVDVPDPTNAPFDLAIVRPRASLPSVSALESALPRQTSAEIASSSCSTTAPVVEQEFEQLPEAAPAPISGFAAPTMDDSAEAVYARAAQAAGPAGPASGVASVVFVDEEPDAEDDRSGALKRLIGSLRRK